MATANVTSVAVDCGHNEWTWMGGLNVVDPATHGDVPSAGSGGATWTDAAGNFWLFGGFGNVVGYLNSLWKYSGGQWMGGPDVGNQKGTYGTQGTPAPGNVPGGRDSAVSWVDAAGNFWLFGGQGFDSGGLGGALNDLWKYSAGQWTWIGGSNVSDQKGKYGTQGTPAAGNIPGARVGAVSWVDAAGNVWLFSGEGYDSAGVGKLNDLWKYSGGQWTWMGGSNVVNQRGTYGTQGTPAPGNAPGARWYSVTWTDAAGNFWLLGGDGTDWAGLNFGYLNDLWKYEP
jgi:hypothetical protein